MYAIIRAGGKQSKVHEGDIIDVERIKSSEESIVFTPLLVVDADGRAISDRAQLAKAEVHARVLGEAQGPKIDIFKYKNKSGYRRRQGHRQKYTTLEVTSIELSAKKKAKAKVEDKPVEAEAAETESAAIEETEEN